MGNIFGQEINNNRIIDRNELEDILQKRDFNKLEQLYNENKNNISIQELIDEAVENNDFEMLKFLSFHLNKNNLDENKPSLYAKQMAHINGYHGIAHFIDEFVGCRNNIGIYTLHYDLEEGWRDIIPENHRYFIN